MGPWRLCGLAPAGADSATERLVDGIEPNREGQQVAVVNPAVVELAYELAEQSRPVLAPCGGRLCGFHPPFDDPDRRQAGGRRPGLLPGSLPAGRRAPFRASSRRLHGDGAAAPAARRLGRPPDLHGGLCRPRTCIRFSGRGSAPLPWWLGLRCPASRTGST